MLDLFETITDILFWIEAYKEHTLVLFIVLSIVVTLLERYLQKTIFAGFSEIAFNLMFANLALLLIFCGIIAAKVSYFGKASVLLCLMGGAILVGLAVASYSTYRIRKRRSKRADNN